MSTRTTLARSVLAVATAGATAVGLTAHAVPLADAGAAAPTISWGECPAEWSAPAGADCGRMDAPLDYSNPDGEKITVAMARIKATDPSKKMGTVFINPGGPGGSSIRSLAGISRQGFSEQVRERFDIVGIDPRGIGATQKFVCVDVEFGPETKLAQPVIATESGESATILKRESALRSACADAQNPVGRFMSTADTARDMDLAREAVGDEKLTFYGVSYGTQLAATYVNMFPSKVRAVVADSAIDPVAWSHGHGRDGFTTPSFARIGSVYGAKAALEALMEDCERVGPQACGDDGKLKADWEYVHATMPSHELSGGLFPTYDDFVLFVTSALYSPTNTAMIPMVVNMTARALELEDPARETRSDAEVSELTNKLDELHQKVRQESDGVPVLARRGFRSVNAPADEVPLPVAMQDTLAIMCSETANPADTTLTMRAADKQNDVVPGEGRVRAWQGSACAQWPLKAKNAYYGPYDKETSNGVLVLGNTLDSATPYERGTKVMHETLPGSRLVTVERGYGHGSVFDSQCAKDAASAYLVTSELPAANMTCRQDSALFE